MYKNKWKYKNKSVLLGQHAGKNLLQPRISILGLFLPFILNSAS